MDTSYQENYNVPIKGFVGKKQTYIFNVFKKHQFSGEVKFVPPNQSEWCFYLSMGRLICGTGGEHSVRRWRRHLAVYLPDIAHDTAYLERQIKSISADNVKFCWEYELLRRWVLEGKADRDSVIRMSTSIMTEIFFDLNQCPEITFHMNQDVHVPLGEQICLFDAKDFIAPAWQQWQKWLNAKLGDRSPNKAPVIRSHKQLEAKTSPKTYSLLVKLFNGKNSLRDLAVKLKKDLFQLSASFLPYIQQGYIDLVSVADLPSPIANSTNANPQVNKPLVVCIDDSPMICETMGTLLVKAGYKFVGITEPLKAIAQILALKPDVIFLDLMMPNTNGYEICAGLRKLSMLKNTPIIILTSNDGMIERVRSRMIGASDFMAKPINAQVVMQTINRHLSSR